MSWLSKATGIHISPHGASLSRPDPIGAGKDALSNPIFDAALAVGLPGIGSAITAGLGAIPGIGGALAAGAGAVGGAASGIGGGIAHAVEAIPGVSSLLGGGGIGGTGLGEGIAGTGAGGIADAAAGGGGGGIGGLLAGAGKWLTGNGGKNALGLAQGVSSVLDQKKSNDYANKAVSTVENAYNEKAPLRAQGLQGLLNPQHADTSNLAAIAGKLNTSNVPQAGQPQDVSSLLGLQSNLQKLQIPTAGALQQFKPPTQVAQAPLPVDKGNPYAAQGA